MRFDKSVVTVLIVGALLLCGSTLAGEKIRQTTDKQPLPEPSTPRLLKTKIPVTNMDLGALPEEVFTGRFYAMDSDLEVVTKWIEMLTLAGVDLRGFDYIGEGKGGSKFTLVAVNGGRVCMVGYTTEGLTWDTIKKRFIVFKALDKSGSPRDTGDWMKAEIKGMLYYATAVGKWSKQIAGEDSIAGDRAASKTQEGPAMIIVGADWMEWQIVHGKCNADIANAIRNEILTEDMTIGDALVAMRNYKVIKIKGDKPDEFTLQWFEQKLKRTTVYLAGDGENESTVVSSTSRARQVVAEAVFSGDRLTKVVKSR